MHLNKYYAMYKELLMNRKKSTYCILLFLLSGVILGLAIPKFLDGIAFLGRNIPQDDIAKDYITALVWALVLGMSILAWPVSLKDKRNLLLVWCAKIFMVLGFMLFFESHYSAMDAYLYFDGPRQNDYVWEGFTVYGGYKNIMNLIWLHHKVLPESFHALKISFAMIGLVAVYVFYRASVIFLQTEVPQVFFAFALFPSILFMSSTIGKEAIVLLGVALYVYGFIAWYRFKKYGYLWVLVLGMMTVMLSSRLWLAPILLIPAMIVFLRVENNRMIRTFCIVLTGILIWVSLNKIIDMWDLISIEALVKKIDYFVVNFRRGGSQIGDVRFTSIGDLILYVPWGVFTALFRPLPGDVISVFGILASLENVMLLILLGMAVKRTRLRELKEPIVMWAILLVLIWAIVYGFVSQNLGTVVRYKLQILPILLGLLLYLSRRRPGTIPAS